MPKPIRPVVIDGDVVRVPLTQGMEAVVDLADLSLVEGRNWCAKRGRRTFYASAKVKATTTSGCTSLLMHRVIMGFGPGDPRQVDHIDHDGLNNRRLNLRDATASQNQMNQLPQVGCSSRFKGVYWFKRNQRWQAEIQVDGRRRDLGAFHDEEDAARAYDAAARKVFGEYARLNFPL